MSVAVTLHRWGKGIASCADECMKSEAERIQPFLPEELTECVACTCLTKKEILQLWRSFRRARRSDLGDTREIEAACLAAEQKRLAKGINAGRVPPSVVMHQSPLRQLSESNELLAPANSPEPNNQSQDGPTSSPLMNVGTIWSASHTYAQSEVCQIQVRSSMAAPGAMDPKLSIAWMPYKSMQAKNVANDPLDTPHLSKSVDVGWKYDPFSETLSRAQLKTIDVLHHNPFTDRLVDIFSERKDGRLTFEEFLDLFSTFHARAPRIDKVKTGFRIYDIDGDGFITPSDLKKSLFYVFNAGFDWEGRDDKIMKDKQSKSKEMRRAVFNFLEYLEEERAPEDFLVSPAGKKKGKKFKSNKAMSPASGQIEEQIDGLLDGRKRARLDTWVESTLRAYNDQVKKAKEEGTALWELEVLSDEDMRKKGKKLDEVATKWIIEATKLPLAELTGWTVERGGNPLQEEEATQVFAEMGFGKNLFRDMAAQIREDKHNHMVDEFLDIYVGEVDDDLRLKIERDLSQLLHGFLEAVDLDDCLDKRARDPKADDQSLFHKWSKDGETDMSSLPEWRGIVLEYVTDRNRMAECEKPDESPEERQRLVSKEVVSSFLDPQELKMVISKLMLEGDPSITEEDQIKQGWDSTGKMSCQEFAKMLSALPDFEKKMTMSIPF